MLLKVGASLPGDTWGSVPMLAPVGLPHLPSDAPAMPGCCPCSLRLSGRERCWYLWLRPVGSLDSGGVVKRPGDLGLGSQVL